MVLATATDELGLSFVKGLVSAVNPCAFVLLPTYLMLFLGINTGSDTRISMRRALAVSGAVSAGFLTVFLALGAITEYATGWFRENAKYFTGVIGVAFIIIGAAMLFGWAPKVRLFGLGAATARVDASARGMFVYGVAYAVASLGCTLPLFTTTVFDGATRGGFGKAMSNVTAYTLAIVLVITALTIALAFADTGLARLLRSASQYTSMIGAAFVLLSGLYLVYYFWTVDVQEGTNPLETAVSDLQQWVQRSFVDHTAVVALALGAVVALGAAVVLRRRAVPIARVGSPGSDD